MSHSPLTAAERLALDAADGVIDGKVGSVDVDSMTHDKTKSTTEGEWELKDGKYYRRDYYSANTQQKEEDPRDKIIADLRRQISEQEFTITELRSLLATRDRLIAELRAELAECRSQCSTYTTRINDLLAQITRLEQRITVLSSKKEEIIVQQPVVQPIQVQQDNSYYVVRSERGAALLNQYGKSNFVVDPFRPPTFGPTQPLTPSFQVQQQQVVVQQAPAVTETVFKEERVVQSSTPAPESRSIVKEREYVRVSDAAELARLDALDGSVDGKYNGMDIKIAGEVGNEGWHTTSVTTGAGAAAAATGASSASAGWAVKSGGASSGWQASSSKGASWSTGGSVVTKESQWVNASSAEQAARLDALDGKIDGKYNGVEIRDNSSPAPRGMSAGVLTKN